MYVFYHYQYQKSHHYIRVLKGEHVNIE